MKKTFLVYVENPSALPNILNEISLAGLVGLAQINLDGISSRLKFLEETFKERNKELKQESVDNKT